MSYNVRLSAEQIDEIAQFMRAGLGLALLGFGWGLIQVYQNGNFSAEYILGALSIAGSLEYFFTNFIFSGLIGDYVTPEILLKGAMGLILAAAVFIITGFWIRFYGLLLAFIFGVPWLINLVDAVPWVVSSSDLPVIQGSIMSTYNLGITMLFLVLANIGPGTHSIDSRFHFPGLMSKNLKWNNVALHLRFGLAFLFIGAALSQIWFEIDTYGAPSGMTLFIGVLVFFGLAPKTVGFFSLAMIGLHLKANLTDVENISQVLEVVLPQAPFIAAGAIYFMAGGGESLRPNIKLTRTMWGQVDD